MMLKERPHRNMGPFLFGFQGGYQYRFTTLLCKWFVKFIGSFAERVSQSTEFFDSTFDSVSGLQELTGGHRHACGGAGGNDIARLSSHYVTEERNDIGD